jgi:L-ascorbate metabolism protein UlaG (beta-lactamase superfamily)
VAPHKPNQFLWRCLVAVEAETTLLGHCATVLRLRRLHLLVDPLFGRAATTHLHNRLSGLAGRGLAANIVVAIAHDCDPFADVRS